jgi:hypothetical protein
VLQQQEQGVEEEQPEVKKLLAPSELEVNTAEAVSAANVVKQHGCDAP